MAELTLDDLTQRALTVGILAPNQLQELWQRLRTQRVEPQVFLQEVVRLGFLTSYQVDLLASGEMTGYFFGEYKALYTIGSGTFARVYRASHRDSGKIVALKVLRARFNTDPQIVEHFTHEAEIGIELRHPNIVPIYEVYSKKGLHFMVMDFIEGQTLRDFVNVRKKLDAKVATRLATDIAQGLDYAVRRGVQHRDLKLSNVLLSSGGKAMLADFGLAAIDETKFVAMTEVKNQRALDYAALERFTGVKRDDPRSDIYFLGCIYYNLLSGVAPLLDTHDRAKRMEKSRYYNVKPVLTVDTTIPQAVAFVVNKTMAFDPEKRYQSMAELLGDLAVCTKRLSDGTANVAVEMSGMLGDSLAARKSFGSAATGGGTAETTSTGSGGGGVAAEGPKFTVMIVESDAKMQNAFRDALKKYNYRALVVSTAERVMDRFYDDGKVADIVIFNAQTLGMSAIEGFNRMLEDRDTKLVPSILLLDDAHGAYLKDIQRDKHRVVLAQPITMRSLRETMERLLSARTGKPITAANPTTVAAAMKTTTAAIPPTAQQTEHDEEEAEPILDAIAAAENGEFNDDAWAAAERELMGETVATENQENEVAQHDEEYEDEEEEENVEYQEEYEEVEEEVYEEEYEEELAEGEEYEYEEVVEEEEVYEEEYESEEPAEGEEEYEYEEVVEEVYEEEPEHEVAAEGEEYEYEEVIEEEEVYEEEEPEPESEVAVEEEEYEYEEVVEEVYEEDLEPESDITAEEEYEYEEETEEIVEDVVEEYEEESESTHDLEPESQSELSHIEDVAEVVDTADIQGVDVERGVAVTSDTQGFVPSDDGVGSYWGGSTLIQAVLALDNRSDVMSASVVSPISQLPQEFRWSSDANWLFPISVTPPPRNDVLPEISPEILPTPTEPEVSPLPEFTSEQEPVSVSVLTPPPEEVVELSVESSPEPEQEPVMVTPATRAGGVSPPLSGAPLVRKKIVKKVVVSSHRPIGVVSSTPPPVSVPVSIPTPPPPPPPPIPEPEPVPEPATVPVAEVRKKVVKKIVKKVIRREI